MSIKTKLTNIESGVPIYLSNSLYPVDEHNWSKVASNVTYTLDGGIVVQQCEKKAGRPYTLTAPEHMGWLRRSTLNRLKSERDTIGQKYWLDYLCNDDSNADVRRVKVIFDTTKEDTIIATPVEKIVSPNLDDYFHVTLKFIEVE